MGYDYDNQLLSLLRDKSKEGMAIAILGPRRSLQLKASRTMPYLITHETSQQTERHRTKIDEEAPTRDTDERARGKSSRELNQPKSSWRMLKDRFLTPNSCNQARCPMIKERLELHHQEIHGRDSYPKSSTVGTSRSKNCSCKSKLDVNQNSHQNKFFTKPSLNLSPFDINSDKNISKSKDQNNDMCIIKLIPKYQDNGMKPSKGNLINKDSKKYTDGFTVPYHNANFEINDDNKDTNPNSNRYVDNSTTVDVSNLVENRNKNIDGGSDYPEKLKDNNTQEQHSVAAFCKAVLDCCTSPCNFNLPSQIKKNDASSSCNVPVSENCTTTYSNSYTGEVVDLRRLSYSRKRNFDQISNSSITESKVKLNCEDIPTKSSKIMTDSSNSPKKGSKVMISNCNSVQSGINIPRNRNHDINLPSTSRNCNRNTYNSNFDQQMYDSGIPCGIQTSNLNFYNNIYCKNFEKPEYVNDYITTYRDAYTSQIDTKALKYPLVPLKKDFNQICRRSNFTIINNTSLDKNQPKLSRCCKNCVQKFEISNKSININEVLVDNGPPYINQNNCCCGGSKKPQITDDYTTTYSFTCIDNFENPEMVLISTKENFNQTLKNTHELERKTLIDNSNSAQFVINIAENVSTNKNQTNPKTCKDVCETQVSYNGENLHNGNNSEKLKCDEFCTTTYNNAYTGNIEVTLQYPLVPREEKVVCSRAMDKKYISAMQTDNCAANKQSNNVCRTSLNTPGYVDNSTTTFSDTLLDTIKSMFPLVPCKGSLDQIDKKPCSNIDENTNTNVCKRITSKTSNGSQTKKKRSVKPCECSDGSVSNKKPKLVDKSINCETSNMSSGKSSKKIKQLPYCISRTDSSSLDSHTKILSCSDSINDSSKSDSKLAIKGMKNNNTYRCPIFKEVIEWIRGVPVKPATEKESTECNEEAINDLVRKLKKLSEEANNPKFDEKVRNEIDMCLSKISICYPGDKREKCGFKQSLVHRLLQKLKNLNKKNVGTTYSITKVRQPFDSCKINFNSKILSKDVEIRIIITQWLRSITNNNNMTENQISQLADFVVIRINPLMNIPVSTYNHRIILKAAIVNVINDLSIGNISMLQNKDVQIHNYAKDLTDKLLFIQEKHANSYKKSNLSTNKYSELKDCIVKRETVICSEIKKCFENACVEPKGILIEEVGVILMDCYEIPHPEAERDAKKEIVNILVNSTKMSETQASRLAKDVMRKVRRVLHNRQLRREGERSLFSMQAQNLCTVLVCTSMERDSPLTYPINFTPNKS